MRQKIYYPADEEKIPLLLGLLSRSEGARTMVFVNTKAFVERVARSLEKAGYRVGVLSGDVPQKKRESLLKKFQAGQLEILVATDVAARGLHIDGVSHVYNYDLPFDAEDYVHRIGRTARLGAEGDAISFACERYAHVAARHRGLHRPEDAGRTRDAGHAGRAAARAACGRSKPMPGEDDSIRTIFREAREQKAADEQRRGGGRGKPGGSAFGQWPRAGAVPRVAAASAAPRVRRASAKATSWRPMPRRRSKPHPSPSRAGAKPHGNGEADAEGERAPRKRRRRRGGKPHRRRRHDCRPRPHRPPPAARSRRPRPTAASARCWPASARA